MFWRTYMRWFLWYHIDIISNIRIPLMLHSHALYLYHNNFFLLKIIFRLFKSSYKVLILMHNLSTPLNVWFRLFMLNMLLCFLLRLSQLQLCSLLIRLSKLYKLSPILWLKNLKLLLLQQHLDYMLRLLTSSPIQFLCLKHTYQLMSPVRSLLNQTVRLWNNISELDKILYRTCLKWLIF